MTSVPLFEIETRGLLTTVQGAGGAMDTFAASVANILTGNSRDAPLLEITLIGPTLRVLFDSQIALCGADLSAAVDGQPLPLWKTLMVRAGQRVTFGRRRTGARVYLAASGSRFPAERGLRTADIPSYLLPAFLRVVPGPHLTAFTASVLETLSDSTYLVTPQSDRMGYRLSGPPIERTDSNDILSEAMPFGGLQVPPDGQPILLMAERQRTGGYPLLGTVVSVDLPSAAQLAPGDEVRFQAVTLAEAQESAIRREQFLRVIGAKSS